MSSFNALLRGGLLSLALLAPVLSGCTMAPLYADPAGKAATLGFSYPKPSSRAEQIVYQDLGARFGTDPSRTARVSVSLVPRSTTLSSSTRLGSVMEMRATGTLVITQDGAVLLTVTRSATATYTTASQSLANDAARIAAEEQATHALTEQFRLAILAALGT